MAETLKVWFDANSGVSDKQIQEFLKTKNDDGDFAYFRETKAKNANVLVLPDKATPPIVFNPKTQSAVYRMWVEHVILETAPIIVSRRYQAAFAAQAPQARPVVIQPLSAAMLIESESESLSSSESEEEVKVKKPKKAVSKSSSVVGVTRSSPVVEKPKVAVRALVAVSSSSNGRPRIEKPVSEKSPKSASRNVIAMDVDVPLKANRIKKTNVAKPAGSDKKRAREEEEDYDADDLSELAPKTKSVKRAASSRAKNTSASGVDEVEEVSPVKRVKEPRAPSLGPDAPRVYLSQASTTDKAYYKQNLHGIMTFVPEVSQATHCVSFGTSLDTESPLSFSLLYAIGTGRWVLDRSWLIEAAAKKVIPAPEKYEIRELPGARLIRRAQAARKAYLEANGLQERNADEEADPNLPKLVFSPWTFYLEPLRKHFTITVWKQLQEIVTKNGGIIGGEENSDIWIIKDGKEPVLAVRFGEPNPPTPNEITRRQEHPIWNKRYFTEPSMLRQMPTYAIPFDFLRISIASGKCEDPSQYQNLIQYSRAL